VDLEEFTDQVRIGGDVVAASLALLLHALELRRSDPWLFLAKGEDVEEAAEAMREDIDRELELGELVANGLR